MADQIYRGLKGDLQKQIDAKADNTTNFADASERSNIASGETMPTILGKIKKWFGDLKDLAFIAKDGTSSTKFLRGDGTWQNIPSDSSKADKAMGYLHVLIDDVDTEINNYNIIFNLIGSIYYPLVNEDEMLSHRFLFVEIFINPQSGSKELKYSVFIDPNSLNGFPYKMNLSNKDDLNIEYYPSDNGFGIQFLTIDQTYNDGDPTNYYLTIRLMD